MTFLVSLLAVSCGSSGAETAGTPSDGGGGGGVEPPPPASCATTEEGINGYWDMPVVTIADVTGDGPTDVVAVVGPGMAARFDLEVGEPVVAMLSGFDNFLALGSADLDDDGQGDLIVGEPWEVRVRIYRGPLAGALAATDAHLTIEGPAVEGDLASWMGAAVAVVDLNDDGARDVLVTAPAEREEGCTGTQAPRVYFGPFAPGAQLSEDDVDLRLGDVDPIGSCLGEAIHCLDGAVRLSSDDTPSCWSFPVVGPEPSACP